MYIENLVSVIIPTYRRSTKINRAIASVLNQSYNNIELIVVNDNEPEDEYTKQLVENVSIFFSDQRFRLLMQEKHVNGAVARNFGINNAQGQYIAFLDDDDWWAVEKLQRQINVLSSLPDDWGGVSCKFYLCNEDEMIIQKSPKYKDGRIYKDILSLSSEVTTCSLLLRRKCLDSTGYFDEDLTRNQDIQLLTRFTFEYKLKLVDDYLLYIDVSDAQNRLIDESNLLQCRASLFNSVKPILSTLSSSELNTINSIRDVELGYVLLKNKQIIRGLQYSISAFNSLLVFKVVALKLIQKYIKL